VLPERYTLSNLRHALRNPASIRRELRWLAYKPVQFATDVHLRRKYDDDVDVMKEDWDNLVILDACRYDYFEETNWLDGQFQPVVSPGHRSWEFMKASFLGRELHDTVYVTANPHAVKLPNDTFHATRVLLDRWDEEVGVVQPADVVAAAIEAHEAFSNKRLIVHFMQPHRPHLGPTAEAYRERVDLKGLDKHIGYDDKSHERSGLDFGEALNSGEITVEETQQAYRETLEIVLNHVEDLLDQLDGKSVVTADHGQLLGEWVTPLDRTQFGHPYHLYTPSLRVVPWFEVESDDRREVVSADPVESNVEFDDETVNSRLRDLGYVAE